MTVAPKGRDAAEVRTYYERFESKYKIGDVVYVNGPDGRPQLPRGVQACARRRHPRVA